MIIVKLLAPVLLLTGCVTEVAQFKLAPDHPANSEAGTAPLPVLTRSLQSYDPASAPAPERPGSEMDHGSMGHGAMKGMDHGAHWMAPPEEAARKNPVPSNTASIERGKKIFEANCVTCHGETGRGDGPAAAALNPKPADLTVMAGQHSDGDFAWKIANGRGPMPAWKGVLDEKQIWDAVNFVQSFGGSKSRSKDTGHDHSKH